MAGESGGGGFKAFGPKPRPAEPGGIGGKSRFLPTFLASHRFGLGRNAGSLRHKREDLDLEVFVWTQPPGELHSCCHDIQCVHACR